MFPPLLTPMEEGEGQQGMPSGWRSPAGQSGLRALALEACFLLLPALFSHHKQNTKMQYWLKVPVLLNETESQCLNKLDQHKNGSNPKFRSN